MEDKEVIQGYVTINILAQVKMNRPLDVEEEMFYRKMCRALGTRAELMQILFQRQVDAERDKDDGSTTASGGGQEQTT